MSLLRSLAILLLGLGALLGAFNKLSADEVFVAKGWNLYQTDSYTGLEVGPFGHHIFHSVPLNTFDFGGSIGVRNNLGRTDIIVQRLDDGFPNYSPVEIEVLAMSLRSVSPIDIGGGLEFVSTTVSSSSGAIYLLDDPIIFDFEWNVNLLFTGETSGIGVTSSFPILIAGLDWRWGRTPLENNAKQITGVNRFLDGEGTTAQDFWPLEEIYILEGGFGTLRNATIPEPSSTALVSVGLIACWMCRRRSAFEK